MDIKLSKEDKRVIGGTEDVFSIMQRILSRENKIDKEKEHFWIIGMNDGGYILYIELVALGTIRSVEIEPMNVYRVAVMKNASRIIAIHNHPSSNLAPSIADQDVTDQLIQVGRILNIMLTDHLIINPETYVSFRALGLMDDLEKSLKYVPTYQIVEQIRKEERAIAREKIKSEKDKVKSAKAETKVAKEAEKAAKEKLASAILFLKEKGISHEQIANILDIDLKDV